MISRYLIIIFVGLASIVSSQVSLNYKTPNADILKLADVSPPPSIRLDAAGKRAILLHRNSFKTIEELSEPELKLAGLRINPNNNSSSRGLSFYNATILDVASGKESKITGLPVDAKLTSPSWNHKQNKITVLNIKASTVELWVVDLDAKSAKKLTEGVNNNLGNPVSWMKDDKSVLVNKVPADRKSIIDRNSQVPTGPTVSESEGKQAQNRTYQDLLKNPTDEYNFEQLARSEIVQIDVATYKITKWMPANLCDAISLSPDGQKILLRTIQKPFSYLVPYDRFPFHVDVYDKAGKLIKNVYKSPLIEDVPKGFSATVKGPRGITWRRDTDADLVWVEALDEGDPAKKVEYRDAVFTLQAPYTGEKKELAKTKDRYAGIMWGDANTAVIMESWYDTRKIKTSIFNPSNPDAPSVVFNERNSQNIYADPGDFVTEQNKNGSYILAIDKGSLFLVGDGYSAKGKNPFVDKYEIVTQKKTRLYESSLKEKLESISSALDVRKGLFLTSIESKTEYPNFYIRDINANTAKQVTFNKNPFEAIQNVHKEVINYKRYDGVDLTGTLYLPIGYNKEKKDKLPLLMWAYPREFKDASTASQTTSSPYQFTYLNYGSPLYWVARGFAVLDNAAFPILGEGDKEPNDNFIEQLVGNGKAAIDAVDALGYVDRAKVAVGGHSYGAFMTANLLSHSNLFAAGIARSGAYNRTLTPFGFQSEQRTYWDAPEVYNEMSPFQNANKMKTPLLLIHGEDDNNSGTFPLQSERYFVSIRPSTPLKIPIYQDVYYKPVG
jgi:dipeptidyl aminopeptidase/acylaminoacyl peptidase